MNDIIAALTEPNKLYSYLDIPNIPKESGIYGWYFKEIPPSVPTDRCVVVDGKTLLYAGISPSRPSSSGTIHKRIRQHYKTKARSSTLRMSLGVLLSEKNPSPLRRVSKDNRKFSFSPEGEKWLSEWMEENAFVCWIEHEEPWNVERGVITNVALPLNIDENPHPFATVLSHMRREAKREADNMSPLE